MRDKLVSTITNLCDILKDRTLLLETTEDMALKAVDLGVTVQEELDHVRDELRMSERRIEDLQFDVDNANRRARDAAFDARPIHDFKQSGHAALFNFFMQNPERVMGAIAYLRGTTVEERFNKIGLIKKVREMTFCGLKEAKDLVESFLENPTHAADTIPAPVDPNPCKDSASLNGSVPFSDNGN